eukprot:3903183-Rhodomonas_salina.1
MPHTEERNSDSDSLLKVKTLSVCLDTTDAVCLDGADVECGVLRVAANPALCALHSVTHCTQRSTLSNPTLCTLAKPHGR